MKKPVIVVTGASQGIGAAIARAFARAAPGARLALVARTESGLRRTAAACEAEGARAAVLPCDVSDEASVAAMGAAVARLWGVPDVLVNNAGRFEAAPLAGTTAALLDRMLAANLRSVLLVSQVFLPGMVARGRGDIFNMGSIAALRPLEGSAAYCAAKAGVAALTGVMRAELRDKGVRVCAVHPGATFSPSWKGSGVPASRMMPAGDVARAIVDAWRLGRGTVVEEIVLRPQLGDL